MIFSDAHDYALCKANKDRNELGKVVRKQQQGADNHHYL